jgi:hypothetical protein
MERKILYKYNGQYWGFVLKGRIYNKDAKYFGWIDKKNRCWNYDGDYIGNLVEDKYIIQKNIYTEPVGRIPKIPRAEPVKIADQPNIKAKILTTNYYDVLERLN